MAKKMFVDIERCIGCWTCAMACKMCHDLADDEYRVTVRTNGSGAGIDRPEGPFAQAYKRCEDKGFRIFEPEAAEGEKAGVVYACRQ